MTRAAPDRIGFVGLGNLGTALARNLLKAGFELTAYDVRAEAVEAVCASGAAAAHSLAEIARACPVVCVCVLDDEQVLDVVLGKDGLLSTDAAGGTLIIHSTVTPQTVDRVAEAANGTWTVLDAPLSGSREAAVAGKLTVMVGASPEAFARHLPLFEAVGENVFHIGERPGAGSIAKLCNNLMAACNNLASLEAMKLGAAYGLDERTVVEVARVSSGDSWWIQNWGALDQMMSSHSSSDAYYLFTKDVWDAVAAARKQGVHLPIAGVAALVGPQLLEERDRAVSNADERT
jgi:L-serine 3-dehydrogenase (NAD+)